MQDVAVTQSGLLIPALLSGYTLSIFAPWLNRLLRQLAGWLIALLPFSLFVYFLTLLPRVAAGEQIGATIRWVPSLDVNLSFVVDGWGLFMALIVTGMGALVIVYASSYLRGHAEIGRFYAFILMFMASMLVLVLSDNIFLLFFGWEMTSIASFFLIGFYHNQEKAQKAALQALLVTGAGGLAMLAGLVLLSTAAGSPELSAILQSGDAIRSSSLYAPAVLLILLGAFTKSAQFPFHFWLPNAMAGPAPVSTYLHSATMVKAGVYLLARLSPAVGSTTLWFWLLVSAGALTAVLGAWLSWQQTDLKGILAYSTVSALGTLVLLIGLGTESALATAVVFLLVHALYKGALFMAAGIVDHETGTRDVRQLGGLSRAMPFTFAAVALAALSMAGLPPLFGFVSKELMYASTLAFDGASLLFTAVLLVTNVCMVAAAGVLAIGPFLGPPTAVQPPHKTPFNLWLGPVLLGVLALGLGLASASPFVNDVLLGPAVSSVVGEPVHLHLALWHGPSPMLLLSGVTVAAGAALYATHGRLRPAAVALSGRAARIGPAHGYDTALDWTLRTADFVTRHLQNGHLRWYLLYVIITLIGLVGYTLWQRAEVPWIDTFQPVRGYELLLAAVIGLAALMVVRVESRLTAVAGLGVIGYGIAVLFILFGAPDLAMTQFSIETLTVILFVLVLYRLPAFEKFSSSRARLRDALVAATVGLLMAALVLAAHSTRVAGQTVLTEWYADFTHTLGHGRNIVNVILVDFRGFDTLFEITVLSVAAIGVYALLKSRPQNRPHERDATQAPAGMEGTRSNTEVAQSGTEGT